jgi:hypothetical protein
MFSQAFLRGRQLVRSLRAQPLDRAELETVSRVLNSGQLKLFLQLPVYEQRHALNVYNTLVVGGYDNPELLQAGLLHDIGKFDAATGRSIPVWGKVANVVLSKIGGKNLVSRLAKEQPASWRYVFWLQTHHEQRGAKLAQAAGSSPQVVALLGEYATLERNGDPTARALKWADDQN